jgi:hypothetical protein
MGTYRCICGSESRNCVRCGGTGLVTRNPAPVVRPSRNFAQAAQENPLPTPTPKPTKKDASPRRRTPRDTSTQSSGWLAHIERQLPSVMDQFKRSGYSNLSPFAKHISLVTTYFLFTSPSFDPHSLKSCSAKRIDFFAYPDVVDDWVESTKSINAQAARRQYALEVRKIVTLARDLYEENKSSPQKSAKGFID